MSIKSIAYGTEDGINYFVQTCCGEEHYGQDCDCKNYGEKFTEAEAKKVADELAEKHAVNIERW